MAGTAAVAGPATSAGADVLLETLPAIPLGALIPGDSAYATAIDGDIVLATATATAKYGPETWDPEWETYYRPPLDHAVAWDLSDPKPAAGPGPGPAGRGREPRRRRGRSPGRG